MKVINKLVNTFFSLFGGFCFDSVGGRVKIDLPLRIYGGKHMIFESGVRIKTFGFLAAVNLTGFLPEIRIRKNAVVGHYVHIIATRRVEIGEEALIADRVFIADNSHGYADIQIPIKDQELKQLNDVRIGRNTWIGENVCIIGCSIGTHCVIGANSVVTSDIPDYCVAAGSPAKVIKKYDSAEKKWIRC